MSEKALSIIAYLTVVGWVFSYFTFRNKKSNLLQYHLHQSLGIFVVSLAVGMLALILRQFPISPAILLAIPGIFLFVLWGMGMINALNEAERPVPIIGSFFEHQFNFIR